MTGLGLLRWCDDRGTREQGIGNREKRLSVDRPLLMGILNVTPDSFSDGGRFFDGDKPLHEEAYRAALAMIPYAEIIDIGGESTRPGAELVSEKVELERVVPATIMVAHGKTGTKVSIDTSKSGVARECLSQQYGAWMINDVTALGDPEMAKVCAEAGCQVCLMHMQGTPQSMQKDPTYKDVVREVLEYLLERVAYANSEGVGPNDIWIDPGFGFGKTYEHNLELLRNLDAFVQTGYKVLIGVSRKSFLGRLSSAGSGPVPVEERLPATLVAHVLAQKAGVACIRTHDVKEARHVIEMTAQILRP